MSLDLDRAAVFDHREGQFEFAFRIDAGRQAVEFEAEMAAARGRALRRLRDGQGPLRTRAFDKQFDRLGRVRFEIDRDQRLGRFVDEARAYAGLGDADWFEYM